MKIEDNLKKIIKHDKDIENLGSQLEAMANEKVTKGEGGVITTAMLSQEVKESITGGSVAVVGKNTILEENIIDGEVTGKKLSITEKCLNDYIIKVDNKKIDTVSGTNKFVDDVTCFLVYVPLDKITTTIKFNYPRRTLRNLITNITDSVGNIGSGLYTDPYTSYYSTLHSRLKTNKGTYKYMCFEFSKDTANFEEFKVIDITLSGKNNSLIDTKHMPSNYKDTLLINSNYNLIDHSAWTEGIIEYTTGEMIGKEDNYISNLFPITQNIKYYLNDYASNSDLRILYFDSDKRYLGNFIYATTEYTQKIGITFTNTSACYGAIRLSKAKWDIAKDTINISTEDPALFKNPIGENTIINPKHLNGVYDNTIVLPQNTSYYYRNKNLCVLGDSLTQNTSGRGVALAKVCGFAKYYNRGIGGTSVEVANKIDHESTTNTSMCTNKRVNELPEDLDYLVIMAGTNGSAISGDLSLSNSDPTTFIGAYNVMLSKIYYRYKVSNGYYADINYSGVNQISGEQRDIKIVIVTPPQAFRPTGSEIPDIIFPTGKLFTRGEDLLRMSRAWGLPCLDSMSTMQMNVFNKYLSINDTDGTHFNLRSQMILDNALIGLFRSFEPIPVGTINMSINHLNR